MVASIVQVPEDPVAEFSRKPTEHQQLKHGRQNISISQEKASLGHFHKQLTCMTFNTKRKTRQERGGKEYKIGFVDVVDDGGASEERHDDDDGGPRQRRRAGWGPPSSELPAHSYCFSRSLTQMHRVGSSFLFSILLCNYAKCSVHKTHSGTINLLL